VAKSIVAYTTTVNGEPRVCGKKVFFETENKHTLYRCFPWSSAYFRKWDSLSVSKKLIDAILTDPEITEVQYATTGTDKSLYTINKMDFKLHSRPGNFGEEEQYYVPLAYWTKTTRTFTPDITSETQAI